MPEKVTPENRSRTWNAFMVFAAIVYPSLLTWIYFVLLKDKAPSVQQTAYGAGKFIQFGFPIAWIWFFDRVYFRDRKIFGHFSKVTKYDLIGIGFGVLVVVAMITIYFGFLSSSEIGSVLVDKVKQKTMGMGIDSPDKFMALGVFYAICHSFLEEYYWRWFVFGQLESYVSTMWAIVISSFGFMAHHVILLTVFFGINSPLAYLLAFGVGIGGAFWAWLCNRSESLKASWISHFVIDAGIFSLGYLMIRPYLI